MTNHARSFATLCVLTQKRDLSSRDRVMNVHKFQYNSKQQGWQIYLMVKLAKPNAQTRFQHYMQVYRSKPA